MALFREYRRYGLIPVAGLALCAYYLLVFKPLEHRARSLDEPLQSAWRKLAVSMEQSNAVTLDFHHLTNQLTETRQALATFQKAKKEVTTRLQLNPVLHAKMAAPFQLVDYQNQRSKQMDEFDKQAKQQQVTVEPVVWSGFPEHTADTVDPTVLWSALALTESVLNTALSCKVAVIHSLEVPLSFTNFLTFDVAPRWEEIPIQLEFTAPADNAARFMQSLPLRAEDLKAAGLPAVSAEKLPVFIDRLIFKKQTPEKVDEVRVWVRAVGYVHRE